MKKLIYIAGIALAAFLSSCTVEQFDSDGAAGKTIINAVMSQDITRTVMGDKTGENKYPVTWQSTDRIAVNGVTATSIEVKSPASNAAFTFASAVAAPYCAVYPASAYVADSYNSSEKSVHINIPATQTYTAGSFDPAAGILVGYSAEDGNITFKQAVAYMKITVSGGGTLANIKSIKIWSEDHRRISGDFKMDCSGEAVIADGAFGGSSITLDCGVSGVAQGIPMVIALPAQNYPSGMKMLITDVDGNYQEITSWANEWGTVDASKPMVLSAGTVYPTTIPYTATALVPVEFPVYFPVGYASSEINGTPKSTAVSSYCHNTTQTLWRPASNSDADGIYINNLQSHKGRFVSKQQTQASFKWHFVNEPDAYRPSGKTYRPYVEFAGGATNSSTLLAGPGIKGIWTGDYFEFDLPVRDFAAGTKLQFTFAACNKNAPTFWRVDYLDGDTWKTTAAPGCTAPDGVTTATATWAIPYNYAPKLSTTMTFANAVALGHLYIRLVCVDGGIITTGLTANSTVTEPFNSGSGCTGNFYLCEKSAERNPDKTQDAWGNAIVDQTQSISFTIVP